MMWWESVPRSLTRMTKKWLGSGYRNKVQDLIRMEFLRPCGTLFHETCLSARVYGAI